MAIFYWKNCSLTASSIYYNNNVFRNYTILSVRTITISSYWNSETFVDVSINQSTHFIFFVFKELAPFLIPNLLKASRLFCCYFHKSGHDVHLTTNSTSKQLVLYWTLNSWTLLCHILCPKAHYPHQNQKYRFSFGISYLKYKTSRSNAMASKSEVRKPGFWSYMSSKNVVTRKICVACCRKSFSIKMRHVCLCCPEGCFSMTQYYSSKYYTLVV